jgi:hypothetical protein
MAPDASSRAAAGSANCLGQTLAIAVIGAIGLSRADAYVRLVVAAYMLGVLFGIAYGLNPWQVALRIVPNSLVTLVVLYPVLKRWLASVSARWLLGLGGAGEGGDAEQRQPEQGLGPEGSRLAVELAPRAEAMSRRLFALYGTSRVRISS